MKKIIILLVLCLFLIAGCAATPIAEIKNKQHVGEEVTVKGTVKKTLKIGRLSGYTLVDKDGSKINVATKQLPEEGSKVTVTGTLKNEFMMGYFIKT